MTLNQSQAQMREGIRQFTNTQGTTALLRHPDAAINDYLNRALGSLHRKLTMALPDQRILSVTTITTEAAESTYPLPTEFDFLISLELTSNGHRSWLQAYEMSERPQLVSPDQPTSGIPFCYRLRGGNIELLPTPADEYSVYAWFVPTASQLTADGDTYDTISRLDEYLIAYASRPIAIKDKNWDLVSACNQIMGELVPEIEALARNRDRNSPPRIVDVYQANRWGQRRR